MKFHIIHPSGAVDVGSHESANGMPLEREGALVGGHVEYVSVLFNGEVCTMVVNEAGATDKYGGPILQPNARATAIYWTATIQSRTPVRYEPLAMSMIHGPAILYEGKLP